MTSKIWGNDNLSKFIDNSHKNCVATFRQYAKIFHIISQIDQLFEDLRASPFPFNDDADAIAPLFIVRARTSFLAATKIAFSGQVMEVYPLLRCTLENAGYCFWIKQKPEIAMTWVRRGEDDKASKACRNVFKIGEIKTAIDNADKNVSNKFSRLYDRAIDMGAHPNIQGNLITSRNADNGWNLPILMPGTLSFKIAVQDVAKYPLVALFVVRLCYPNIFNDEQNKMLEELLSGFKKW